jgi:uncharacterized protein (DUF2062 family)
MKIFFKQILPSISKIKENPNLKMFGKLLHDPNLWHLNRRSLSGGTAVGLFVAFIPLPLQMFIAAAIAIVFRVNLPLSVSLVFITNPITIPIFFYFAYTVGTILLGMEALSMQLLISMEQLYNSIDKILLPLLVGSFVVGSVVALMGYILVNLLWRLHVKNVWRKRVKKKIPLILRANT